MTNRTFIDRYGNKVKAEDDVMQYVERSFIVLNVDNNLLVSYNPEDEIYSFPCDNMMKVSEEPSKEFSLTAYIQDKRILYHEKQIYRVYIADDVDLGDLPFCWCNINDILLNKVFFNMEQYEGFKNVFARVRK